MQVNRINNQQPSFGMKYVRPRTWDPKILKTLMDSTLVREIDAKYPQAKAIFEHEEDSACKLLTYYQLSIALAKDKLVTLFFRCASDYNYDSSLYDCEKRIKNSTLEHLEQTYNRKQYRIQEINEKIENKKTENEAIFARAEAENAKNKSLESVQKESPSFLKFICKIFGIK